MGDPEKKMGGQTMNMTKKRQHLSDYKVQCSDCVCKWMWSERMIFKLGKVLEF